FFLAFTTLAFLAFFPAFFFFRLAIVILLLAAHQCLSSVQVRLDQLLPGLGPPVAQSRSSIVCTTGTDVPPAICTMHPRLPAAIISGSTLAILATLRSRNLFAMSG